MFATNMTLMSGSDRCGAILFLSFFCFYVTECSRPLLFYQASMNNSTVVNCDGQNMQHLPWIVMNRDRCELCTSRTGGIAKHVV